MALKPEQTNFFRVLELTPSPSVASKPTELIQIRGHEVLSLAARRAITLLWHNAHRQGIAEGKDYTIALEALQPTKHKGYDRIGELIEALMTTLIRIHSPSGEIRRVQILGGNDMDSPNRPSGTLTYSFDKRLIEVLQQSTIWGRISLPELMAFSSKYAVSLYEHVSQWVGLDYKTTQLFPLEDMRAILGVEKDKYALFGALNASVLKPAILEVNAFSPFNVAAVPVKTGRAYSHVRLSWWLKTEAEKREAYRAQQRPKSSPRT